MIRLVRLGFALLATVSVSACAMTEDTVSLQYQPMQGVAEIPGARQVGVGVSATDGRVVNRDRVSVKKNGYGMEMAAIRSDRDVAGLVQDAVQTELKARGFRVGEGTAQVKVTLRQFYNDFKVGLFTGDAVADVSITVQVFGAGGNVLLTKAYSSSGKAADIMLASGANAKEALENGLRTTIASLMNDPEFIAAVTKAGASGKPIS